MQNPPGGPNYSLVTPHMSPPGELTFILGLRLKAWHAGRGWMCPTLGNSASYERKMSAWKKR